ncbi:unnamed protein product [Peronospora destructor]|uniref:tRNA-binding domain-containing protein n=1 Tax=Peronospora destructor TaxID=86335 RepID=A0AAV0TM22_9STRA|nr:unnamed protein product [Peronospora destructor]
MLHSAAAVFKKQKTPQQVVVETTWNTVVVGEIVDCYPHPQADRLNVCKVNIGDKENLLQIICGASNVVKEPETGKLKKLKIKKSKLREEVSQGMICSETELGLADKSDGIFICEADAQVGSLVCEHDTIASRLKARGISVPSPQLKVVAAPLQTETEQ